MINKLFLIDIYEQSIRKIANGDLSALSTLYKNAGGMIFSIAFSILKDYQLAQDVMQDTFIKITEKAQTYRGGNAKFWIISISRNLALNTLKERKHLVELNYNTKIRNSSIEEEKLINSIAVSDALDRLSEQEKEIVIYKTMCDLPHKQIAELMNITVSNCRQKYKRAIEKLRDYYLNEGRAIHAKQQRNSEKA